MKVKNKENELENENVRLRQLLTQAGLDAVAGDVAHRLQKLMLAELHHRVKNTLTMVQAIATQTCAEHVECRALGVSYSTARRLDRMQEQLVKTGFHRIVAHSGLVPSRPAEAVVMTARAL